MLLINHYGYYIDIVMLVVCPKGYGFVVFTMHKQTLATAKYELKLEKKYSINLSINLSPYL